MIAENHCSTLFESSCIYIYGGGGGRLYTSWHFIHNKCIYNIHTGCLKCLGQLNISENKMHFWEKCFRQSCRA